MVLLGGCGPSIRMVHQNAEYFERCQGADYDPHAPAEVQHACWSRWLAKYSAAQPKDRVRYARARLAALESGQASEPLPGMGGPVVGTGYTGAFLPSSGDPEGSPPPAVPAQEEPDAAPPASDEGTLPDPPTTANSACRPVCGPQWRDCAAGCRHEPEACLDSCEAEFRTCMAACH